MSETLQFENIRTRNIYIFCFLIQKRHFLRRKQRCLYFIIFSIDVYTYMYNQYIYTMINIYNMIPQLWFHPSHARGLELDKLVRMRNGETWLFLDRALNLKMKAKLCNNKEPSLTAESYLTPAQTWSQFYKIFWGKCLDTVAIKLCVFFWGNSQKTDQN